MGKIKSKPPIENKIYAGLISVCEDMEHKGIYKGNGHHLAQELTISVSIALLPRQQRVIFDALTDTYQSTGEIAKKIGIPSKIVSSQLRQIQECTLLIGSSKEGRLISWKRY